MGRPWWYDNYWENRGAPRRRRRFPGRRTLVWLCLIALSFVLALAGTGFRQGPAPFIAGFIANLCRLLSLAILVRAVLSWFLIGGYSRFVMVMDDLTEPILFPLRRVIPLIGRFDITPIVAIVILTIISEVLSNILLY